MNKPDDKNQQPIEDNKTLDSDKLTLTPEQQAELDRRVTYAIKTARGKWEKETSSKIAEAKKLAAMDEEQRNAYELESARAELAQLKAQKAKSENTAETMKVLGKRQLPAELLDYVLTEDAESTLENIKALEKVLKKWVDAEVSKRIPTQGTPKAGTSKAKLTKEDFAKLPISKQSQIAIDNPELYKELTN